MRCLSLAVAVFDLLFIETGAVGAQLPGSAFNGRSIPHFGYQVRVTGPCCPGEISRRSDRVMVRMAVKDADDIQSLLIRFQFGVDHIHLVDPEANSSFFFDVPDIGHWENRPDHIVLVLDGAEQEATPFERVRLISVNGNFCLYNLIKDKHIRQNIFEKWLTDKG